MQKKNQNQKVYQNKQNKSRNTLRDSKTKKNYKLVKTQQSNSLANQLKEEPAGILVNTTNHSGAHHGGALYPHHMVKHIHANRENHK